MKKIGAIFASIVFAFSAFSFSACGQQEPEQEPREPKKLQLVTTTGDILEGTDEDKIRELYNAGFRYIDFDMYNFTSDCVYMQDGWETEVLRLKGIAEELGMQFVQAHSQGGNPLSSNTDEVEFLVAATIRSIEICEVLGIENTVVHAGVANGLTKEQWFEQNKAFYDRLLPTAAECGVNVLVENSTSANMGSNYHANSGADMLEFIKYVNHPNFHGCWDTGHANCEGEQYDDILALGDEMYAIHYNDNRGNADEHLMIFCGTLDNDEVMRALTDVGYDGYFTFECTASDRTDYTWNGPDLSIITELKPLRPKLYDRAQQEKLLYEAGEHLLSSYNMLAE